MPWFVFDVTVAGLVLIALGRLCERDTETPKWASSFYYVAGLTILAFGGIVVIGRAFVGAITGS